MLQFLEEEVSGQYLTVLPSRWAALVPRMGKKTQQLQSSGALVGAALANAQRSLEEDFSLADQLLAAEHDIYCGAAKYVFGGMPASSPESCDGEPLTRHMQLLLRDLLSELALKEAILADWRRNARSISPDTLRTYAHALIAPKTVHKRDVERVISMAGHV